MKIVKNKLKFIIVLKLIKNDTSSEYRSRDCLSFVESTLNNKNII